jgi:hypothetical protein
MRTPIFQFVRAGMCQYVQMPMRVHARMYIYVLLMYARMCAKSTTLSWGSGVNFVFHTQSCHMRENFWFVCLLLYVYILINKSVLPLSRLQL